MPNDYLIDYSTGHLQIHNGDFVVGEATKQHQRKLLITQKGEYKQHPLVGVGIANYLDDENPDDLLRETRKQFVQDGMAVNKLEVTATGVGVDAEYK